jgi:mannose-6-phosphate isomerase-like protein (cupin superfamily)
MPGDNTMTDAPFRLFDVNRSREGFDEYVKLVRDFAAHDGFRSAMVEELELDEDFYRRPLRPEDLSFISFATPVTADTVARLPSLASQRMLLCINELQICRLPRDGRAESFAEYARFYGDASQVLGARVRPFLENFAFDYVCGDEIKAELKACTTALEALCDEELKFWTEHFSRLREASYLQEGLRFMLIQKWGLAPSKQSAFAKATALGDFDGLALADRPRLDREQADANIAARLAAHCGVTKREHSYWQFYLSTSLGECNLLHALASRPDRALAFWGAAFAAEGASIAFHKLVRDAAQELGLAESKAREPGAEMAEWLARSERALMAVSERYGARGVHAVAAGISVAAAQARSARANLGAQLRWLSSVEKYRDLAKSISARIEAECPDIDRETFVEPREMCSTTHVHDDHRLVVIESGKMVFWGNLGMKLRLEPGEMVLVPEGRLHGSSIESEECTYHQPIIPDEWVRPLMGGLDTAVGAR